MLCRSRVHFYGTVNRSPLVLEYFIYFGVLDNQEVSPDAEGRFVIEWDHSCFIGLLIKGV